MFILKYLGGKTAIVFAVIKIKHIFTFYNAVKNIQGNLHLYKAGHFPMTL